MKLSKTNQQIYLQRLGFYCDLIDGVQGAKHTKAIKDFQKSARLKVDGIYGPKTDKALKKAYKKRDTSKVSKNFAKKEFKCECGGRFCNGYPVTISPKLVGILEKMRSDFKKPITITSGVRCKGYNKSLVGSAPNSAHRYGKAVDVYIPGINLSTIKGRAYKYGAEYSYYGTANMGNAVHINV